MIFSDFYRKQPSEMFCKISVLNNLAIFIGKHLCRSLFLIKLQACNFITEVTLAQVFSREFCKISKNTFLTEHL